MYFDSVMHLQLEQKLNYVKDGKFIAYFVLDKNMQETLTDYYILNYLIVFNTLMIWSFYSYLLEISISSYRSITLGIDPINRADEIPLCILSPRAMLRFYNRLGKPASMGLLYSINSPSCVSFL